MPLPIFTKSGNAYSPFTFDKARFLPVNSPIIPNQSRGIAGGGQAKVKDIGTAEELFMLIINRISETNRDNLLGFIQDSTVNYSESTFTFTDEDGTDTTVRFWDEQIDWPEVRGGALFNVRIILRKEIS